MSLDIVKGEIFRFLRTSTPEVLCIKGKWGVGKTFGWRKFLAEAKEDGTIAYNRYSYVSLFGVNSLEDLRFSIFENTVEKINIGRSPDETTFGSLIAKGTDLARKTRPLVEVVTTFLGRKSTSDILLKSLFLTVRNQLVCIDDLERAGAGLSPRDVLGLISFLKEERSCKIVLLLNDTELKEKEEFEKQLEKVSDQTLLFDLSSSEAAKIALQSDFEMNEIITSRIVSLDITNIRIIRKMERLAVQLIGILNGSDDWLIEQAITTLIIGTWSVQQPHIAPPMSFLRNYNYYSTIMRDKDKKIDADEERWVEILSNYQFRGADELDNAIFDGITNGYFGGTELQQVVESVKKRRLPESGSKEFSKAWDELYHGSLSVEDSEFLDALHESASKEASAISFLNINSAIRILREYGRELQANSLIQRYIEVNQDHGPEFFNIQNQHVSADEEIDAALREAFALRRASHIDTRSPLDVLQSIGRRGGWDEADVMLMAKQSVGDFEKMFEALRGRDLRSSIETILILGNSNTEGSAAVRTASRGALRCIARKSPLRARKIRRYGVDLREAEAEPVEAVPELTE